MKGVIQNEEYIWLALREGREFAVVCEDEKEANSKRVSLYNARKRLTPEDQRKIQIQKMCENDQWMVKVRRGRPKVFEIMKGELVPVEEVFELSQSGLSIMKDMIEQGLGESEILEILIGRGEEELAVRRELKKFGGRE